MTSEDVFKEARRQKRALDLERMLSWVFLLFYTIRGLKNEILFFRDGIVGLESSLDMRLIATISQTLEASGGWNRAENLITWTDSKWKGCPTFFTSWYFGNAMLISLIHAHWSPLGGTCFSCQGRLNMLEIKSGQEREKNRAIHVRRIVPF